MQSACSLVIEKQPWGRGCFLLSTAGTGFCLVSACAQSGFLYSVSQEDVAFVVVCYWQASMLPCMGLLDIQAVQLLWLRSEPNDSYASFCMS